MGRRCKSLQAPEQGYAHRDHRSAKGRSKNANKVSRRKAVAFKTLKQKEAELAKMTDADKYELEMIPFRKKWKFEERVYD